MELIQIPVMDGFLVEQELQLKYLLGMTTSMFIQIDGYNFNLIMPNVDSECMNSFLK